jgi:multisubunit Na+/H+ antiporter MnhF subunit
MNIVLDWVVQLLTCVIFFVLSRSTQPRVATTVNIQILVLVVVILCDITRLGSKLFCDIKMVYENHTFSLPCFIPHISLHKYDVQCTIYYS